MRAFKKLMAGVLACAMLATMATSAFAAATLGDNGKVTLAAGDYTAAEGMTSVLIVPASVWQSNAITGLTNDDILYIDQYDSASDATAALTNGLGVKGGAELEVGDYYLLLGGNTNDGEYAISAFAFSVVEEGGEPSIVWCDVNRDGSVDTADATKLLRFLSTAEAWTVEYADEAEKIRVCDVNKDTAVDTADATKLLRYLSTAEAWPAN